MNEGSCVGIDVHARSVVAGVIDVGSGEVRSQRCRQRAHRRTDARSDPRERCEQPHRRPCSTPETGSTRHLAYPVMRHQPAHMSRDTDVDDSGALPPPNPNPRNNGSAHPCAVDTPHSI